MEIRFFLQVEGLRRSVHGRSWDVLLNGGRTGELLKGLEETDFQDEGEWWLTQFTPGKFGEMIQLDYM